MARAGGIVPLGYRPQTTSATLDRVAPQNKMPAEAGLSGMGCPLLMKAINWGEVLAVCAA
jgi:hypothetical protein